MVNVWVVLGREIALKYICKYCALIVCRQQYCGRGGICLDPCKINTISYPPLPPPPLDYKASYPMANILLKTIDILMNIADRYSHEYSRSFLPKGLVFTPWPRGIVLYYLLSTRQADKKPETNGESG